MRTTGRQIGGLDGRLGVTLLRREPRGVTLTSAGTTALEQARNVLGRLDAMEATMWTLAGVDAGHLRLTAFASVNTFFVPDAIRRFHAEHPGVTITLQHVDPTVDAGVDGRATIRLTPPGQRARW